MGDYLSAKLHGQPVETPAGEPVSRDKAMTAAIAAKLQAGPRAPGDAVDQQANDGTTPSAEAEARSKLEQIDPEIIVAIDDDTDPLHPLAVRLLTAYVALEKIRLQKAGPA